MPALLERLKDEDRDVRRSAADALGRIGSPEAVPALLERLWKLIATTERADEPAIHG